MKTPSILMALTLAYGALPAAHAQSDSASTNSNSPTTPATPAMTADEARQNAAAMNAAALATAGFGALGVGAIPVGFSAAAAALTAYAAMQNQTPDPKAVAAAAAGTPAAGTTLASKPAASAPIVLPTGEVVTPFSNGDVNVCSANSCSAMGSGANYGPYAAYLESKKRAADNQAATNRANASMWTAGPEANAGANKGPVGLLSNNPTTPAGGSSDVGAITGSSGVESLSGEDSDGTSASAEGSGGATDTVGLGGEIRRTIDNPVHGTKSDSVGMKDDKKYSSTAAPEVATGGTSASGLNTAGITSTHVLKFADRAQATIAPVENNERWGDGSAPAEATPRNQEPLSPGGMKSIVGNPGAR